MKLRNLTIKQKNSKLVGPVENWLVNLTQTRIPNDVRNVLALGPGFAVPVLKQKLPLIDICASIEQGALLIDEVNRNNFRNLAIAKTIHTKNTISSKQRAVSFDFRDVNVTKEFVSRNNLLVLRADKGNTTVLVDRDKYVEEISNILNDSNTYEKVKFEYTATFEKENNKLIGNWVRKKYINNNTGSSLTAHFSTTP